MTSRHSKCALLIGASAVAMTFGAPIALAQSEDGAERRTLSTVTVTATKREESLQDVPIAVTAISADEIARAGVADIRDLSTITPSFNMNSTQTESQGSTLRLRGVGTTGNNIGLESSVGVFLDGVYLSRPGVALGDLFDLEQIEVLRGPQGTLFGRNTSAGALSVKTRAPLLEGSDAWANATIGNYNAVSIQAGGSWAAVEDVLGFRVAGAIRQRDGLDEDALGNETRDRDRISLRGQALWQIDPQSSLRLIADFSDADESCCDAPLVLESPIANADPALSAFAAAGVDPLGGIPVSGPGAQDSRITGSTGDTWANPFEQFGISAEYNRDLGFADMTYIGSYRDWRAETIQADYTGLDVYDVPSSLDGDGVPQFGAAFDEIITQSHELRFQGQNGRLDWLVGGYYSNEEIEEVSPFQLGADFSAYLSAGFWYGGILPAFQGLSVTDQAIFAAAPLASGGTLGANVLGPAGTPPFDAALAFAGGTSFEDAYAVNRYTQDSTSWSIFTHNTFQITEQLDAVFGLRWNDESKDGAFEQLAAGGDACFDTILNAGAVAAAVDGATYDDPLAAGTFETLITQFPVVTGCFPFAVEADSGFPGTPETFSDTFEDEELTYTAKLVYQINPDVNVYGSFSHGYKAGGFNLDSTAAIGGADPRFDSETIDAWEIGLKSQLFDGRMRLNAAAFVQEMEDFQVLEFTGVQFITFNVPKAESTGAEVEILALPTDNLTLNISGTYADANYPDDCAPDTATASVTSLCGFDLTNAPEWTLVYGGTYEGTINDNLGWFANAVARSEDDRRTSTGTGLAEDIQEANTKVNLRLGIGAADQSWALELWGNNVFDEQTKNVTFNTPLRGTGTFGTQARSIFLEDPATYGLTLRVRR